MYNSRREFWKLVNDSEENKPFDFSIDLMTMAKTIYPLKIEYVVFMALEMVRLAASKNK